MSTKDFNQSDGWGWLDGIFGTVRCANCGAAYNRTDVNVVGNRDEYWFLRCVCHTCDTQGVGVVILKQIKLGLVTGSAIEESFASTRCANCGTIYLRSDLSLVGNRDQYWFLRSQCHSCKTQGVGVAVVSAASSSAPATTDPSKPSLLVNDVLDAHEILESFNGDVHALFAERPRRDPWKQLFEEKKDDPAWK